MVEEEATTYYLLGAFIFIFILTSNVIGLIPYSFTNTSSLIYTLYIALSIFLGIIIIGVTQQKYEFFNFFLPAGSPFILTPLIAFVELFSFASRVFSLAIRLFANMMAGHTLLKILIGFS
jgi:ATP synthase subunit 6